MKKTTSKTTKKAVLINSKKSKKPAKKQPVKKSGNNARLPKSEKHVGQWMKIPISKKKPAEKEMESVSDKANGKSMSLMDGLQFMNVFSSIRDQFAIHAPQEIPEWFEPEMLPKPKHLDNFSSKFGENSNHPNKDLFLKYYTDDGDWLDEIATSENVDLSDLKNEVKIYNKAFEKRQNEIHAWNHKYKIQRIVQWRWFYANEMVKYKFAFFQKEAELKRAQKK